MRRFLCPPAQGALVAGARLQLDPAASRHLLRVVGLRPGERLGLFDGQGRAATARLLHGEGDVAHVEVEEEEAAPPLPERHLLLAQLKGPAQELALRMATELGATHIWAIEAQRSVAKGDRLDRMERVCAGTLAQCGRAAGPTLRGPLRLIDALDALPADIERRICLPGAEDPPAPAGPAAVLIGPEGGWTPAEVQAALARGCQPMSLGPTVLRAETAVAAALARLYSGAAGDTAT